MEDYDKYVVACYDGHTPGELQRRRLATGAEKGSFMSISQEVFQQAPAYYAENPVTQRMLLCAVDRACAYASQAAAACAEYSRVVAENERLQHQLAQRQTAEDAYRELWLNSDRCYTFDRTGRAVELLNCTFEWAARVIARPPFTPCDYYIVKVRGIASCLVLTGKDFLRDSVLLQRLGELPGVRVSLARSVRGTAYLVRRAINEILQEYCPRFFGGWEEVERNSFRFCLFPNHSTHSDGRSFDAPAETVECPVPSVAASALQQFQRLMRSVQDPFQRRLLTAWIHAAALSTLLDQLGHPLPLALCVFAESFRWQTFINLFFNWFGDCPLSLDDPAPLFGKELLQRKDQPLLILDRWQTSASAVNAKIFGEALETRKVLWKDGKNSAWFPLQALPTILSVEASSLTCSPKVMVLEVTEEDLRDVTVRPEEVEGILHDYLQAFIGWASDHIDQLRHALNHSVQRANTLRGGVLNGDCVQALGVLLGVDAFFQEFLHGCGEDKVSCDIIGDEWEEQLLELLVQTAEKALDGSDYAAQFLDIARSCLISGTLSACSTEYVALPPEKVVFYDNSALYFTSHAFRHVCQRLSQSCPVVVRALRQAGVLLGRPVNATTGLTRVSVWNQYGVRESKQVYKLPRKAFDRLGDPLILGEEEVR